MPLFLACTQFRAEALTERLGVDRRSAAAEWPELEQHEAFDGEDAPREASIPAYNSKPGAPATLYLDFRRTNAAGPNQADEPTCPLGSSARESANARRCASSSARSLIEAKVVVEIWQAIAEKVAHRNINVTTVRPAAGADKNVLQVAVGKLYQECYRSLLQYR